MAIVTSLLHISILLGASIFVCLHQFHTSEANLPCRIQSEMLGYKILNVHNEPLVAVAANCIVLYVHKLSMHTVAKSVQFINIYIGQLQSADHLVGYHSNRYSLS